MNPVSIRILDVNRLKTVTNHFFDMCLTEEEHGAKAFKIFEAIDEKFTKDSMHGLTVLVSVLIIQIP